MSATRRLRDRWRPLCALLLSACLAGAYAYARDGSGERKRWEVEPGVTMPSYAAVEPTATNLNIDLIVLACERIGKSKVLQLQLFLSDNGRLRPIGVSAAELADDPQARMSIDNERYPVRLVFTGDHVLLADGVHGRLSDRVVEAMRTGRTMMLEFELLASRPDHRASFDGNAIVDLQGTAPAEAIMAMRHCASPPDSAIRPPVAAKTGFEAETPTAPRLLK